MLALVSVLEKQWDHERQWSEVPPEVVHLMCRRTNQGASSRLDNACCMCHSQQRAPNRRMQLFDAAPLAAGGVLWKLLLLHVL
jgi:hypothetical protein